MIEEACCLSAERGRVREVEERGEEKGVANSSLACKFRRHPSGYISPFAHSNPVAGVARVEFNGGNRRNNFLGGKAKGNGHSTDGK